MYKGNEFLCNGGGGAPGSICTGKILYPSLKKLIKDFSRLQVGKLLTMDEV